MKPLNELRRAMDAKEQAREAEEMWLMRCRGMSASEIAEVKGVGIVTVYRRLALAKEDRMRADVLEMRALEDARLDRQTYGLGEIAENTRVSPHARVAAYVGMRQVSDSRVKLWGLNIPVENKVELTINSGTVTDELTILSQQLGIENIVDAEVIEDE